MEYPFAKLSFFLVKNHQILEKKKSPHLDSDFRLQALFNFFF
jgi:hypothetical protein